MRSSFVLAACALAVLSNVAAGRESRVANMVRTHKAENLKPTAELMRFAARAEHASKKSMLMNDELQPCGNCVYVMERIKSKEATSLNGICLEVFGATHSQTEYGTCHNVGAALSPNNQVVTKWIDEGCVKVEPYGGRSIVKPCPSHTICAHLRNLEKTAFCKMPESDYVNEIGDTLGADDAGDDAGDDAADDAADDTKADDPKA